jgi:hypothetical protein
MKSPKDVIEAVSDGIDQFHKENNIILSNDDNYNDNINDYDIEQSYTYKLDIPDTNYSHTTHNHIQQGISSPPPTQSSSSCFYIKQILCCICDSPEWSHEVSIIYIYV